MLPSFEAGFPRASTSIQTVRSVVRVQQAQAAAQPAGARVEGDSIREARAHQKPTLASLNDLAKKQTDILSGLIRNPGSYNRLKPLPASTLLQLLKTRGLKPQVQIKLAHALEYAVYDHALPAKNNEKMAIMRAARKLVCTQTGAVNERAMLALNLIEDAAGDMHIINLTRLVDAAIKLKHVPGISPEVRTKLWDAIARLSD